MASEYTYDAFISYSSKDRNFARLLESRLEKYVPPKSIRTPAKHLNVFRYEGDMAGTDYDLAIEQYIRQSSKLILICSPDSANSSYVDGEIKSFLNYNRPENIITLIVRGIPNNEATDETNHLKAFPEAILEVQKMPLAKEYRNFDAKKHRLHKAPFEHTWYKLLADILDQSIDDVTEKESKRKIRNRNRVISFASAIIFILSVLTIYAFNQKNIAETQSRRADDSARVAMEQREYALQQYFIAEEQRQIATDSAIAAQKQRKIAQNERDRASDSARVAMEQRARARTERDRANDSARVAMEQREIAQNQTKKAIANERETNRINELLRAENLALQSVRLNNKDTALAAYQLYKEHKKPTVSDVSRLQSIYEAMYSNIEIPAKPTKFECKSILLLNNVPYCLGTDLSNGQIESGYYPVNSSERQNFTSDDGKVSPINYYSFIPELSSLITFNDAHELECWKLNGNNFSHTFRMQLGENEWIREVAYSPVSGYLAVAGKGPFVHLFKIDQSNDAFVYHELASIDLNVKETIGLFIKKDNILVFDDQGIIRFISYENPTQKTNVNLSVDNPTVVCTNKDQDKVFVGNRAGGISVLNINANGPDSKFDISYSGNTRVEFLHYEPTEQYLIAAFADRLVYIYDLNFIHDKFYKPRVINNLIGKPRAIMVDDSQLFISLSNNTMVSYDLDMERLANSLEKSVGSNTEMVINEQLDN